MRRCPRHRATLRPAAALSHRRRARVSSAALLSPTPLPFHKPPLQWPPSLLCYRRQRLLLWPTKDLRDGLDSTHTTTLEPRGGSSVCPGYSPGRGRQRHVGWPGRLPPKASSYRAMAWHLSARAFRVAPRPANDTARSWTNPRDKWQTTQQTQSCAVVGLLLFLLDLTLRQNILGTVKTHPSR